MPHSFESRFFERFYVEEQFEMRYNDVKGLQIAKLIDIKQLQETEASFMNRRIRMVCFLVIAGIICMVMMKYRNTASADGGNRCVIDFSMYETAIKSTSGVKKIIVTSAAPGNASFTYDLNSAGTAKFYLVGDTVYLAPTNSGDVLCLEGEYMAMFSAFSGAMGDSMLMVEEIDLSGLDTSLLTSAVDWFDSCRSLKKVNLTGLDLSSCTNMEGWFLDCPNLTTIIVNWAQANTSKNTSLYLFFSGCTSLSDFNIGGMDTRNVTTMAAMFEDCTNLTSFDCSQLEVDMLTNTRHMFAGSGLTYFSFKDFNTSGVTNMSGMFEKCENLKMIDLSDICSRNNTNFSYMFCGCKSLTSIDMSHLNTTKATTMEGMFMDCTGLISLDLSSFDTTFVESMYIMFLRCSSLKEINFGSFNTARLKNLGGMFNGCSSLEELDLRTFTTSAVESMSMMFKDCTSLKYVDLSSFDTSRVDSMWSMFEECDSLVNLDLSNFTCETLRMAQTMFWACDNLESVNLSGFRTIHNSYYYSSENGAEVNLVLKRMFFMCPKLQYVDFSNLVIEYGQNAPEPDLSEMFGFPKEAAVVMPPLCICTSSATMRNTILNGSGYSFSSHQTCVNGRCPLCGQCQNVVNGGTHSFNNGICSVCKICQGIAGSGEHKYTNGFCEYCNVADSTVSKNRLVGRSITLTDNISLNVYFNLSDELRNHELTKVVFTLPDNTTSAFRFIGQEMINSEIVCYYSCSLPAKWIDETIAFHLENTDLGYTSKVYYESIKGYAQDIVDGNFDAQTKELAKSLVTYGAYAKRYFSDDAYAIPSDALILDLPAADGMKEELIDYYATIRRNTNRYLLQGCSLSLEDNVVVKFYYSANPSFTSAELTKYKLKYDHTDYSTWTYYYYYEISDWSVVDWGTMAHTADPDFWISYCPLVYIHDMVSQYSEGSLYDLMRAMYGYYTAAMAYWNR